MSADSRTVDADPMYENDVRESVGTFFGLRLFLIGTFLASLVALIKFVLTFGYHRAGADDSRKAFVVGASNFTENAAFAGRQIYSLA